MSSNSQFSQLKSIVKSQQKRLEQAERSLEQMKRANVDSALESLAKQQQHAKLVVANPNSTIAELENALPHLTSAAYQEQARHNIKMQQMQLENEQALASLPNLWETELVQNMQRAYSDGSYQEWQKWRLGQ